MILQPDHTSLLYSVTMRLSRTNRLIAFPDSKMKDKFSSNFLYNRSKNSSNTSSPNCFLNVPPIPALKVDANSFDRGICCGRCSIVSMLKHPFRFITASTSCGDAKYNGQLNESTFSPLILPCFRKEQKFSVSEPK